MHVDVIGMGALGLIYGARLQERTDTAVTFMVRNPRPATESVRLSRADGDRGTLTATVASHSPPVDARADVALVTVPTPSLTDEFLQTLERANKPCVFLTPLFPSDRERAHAVLGKRLVVGMPSAISRTTADGTIRYFLPAVAETLIAPEPHHAAVLSELVERLRQAGFNTRFEADVAKVNAATTMAFLPVALAVDAAGGIDALLDDGDATERMLEAVREAVDVAAHLGPMAEWLRKMTRWAGKRTLSIGVRLARKLSPEAVDFFESHFGSKMHEQNVRMGKEAVALGEKFGVSVEAIRAIVQELG